VLTVHLHVHRVEQHLQHVQLPTAAVVTVAQELQVLQAVTQSVATAEQAMTQVAASALMEHLHVKQPEAVSTTTVALLPSQ
jgi:hypothetical protein